MAREEASPEVMGYFYKAIDQAILLYSATWVVSEANLKRLRTFSRSGAHFITKLFIRPNEDDIWICPVSTKVLEEMSL